MSKRYWWTIRIAHCDYAPPYIDCYTVGFENERMPEGDTSGEYSEYSYDYLALSPDPTGYSGFSQWGERWDWKEDDPTTVRWSDLPEHLRRHVLLRCLDGIRDSEPTGIRFEDEGYGEIDPADYGIDINEYLYKGEA